MKLSIIVICWNDLKVIKDCLKSIFEQTHSISLEVIVSDNGSTDDSLAYIREHYPQVRVLENKANLGFAKGNNAGIKVAQGEYVLILNPDTIVRERAFEKLVAYADRHPEAGAFGCRVLNPDGSDQQPARPLPSLMGYLLSALYLRWLGRISRFFPSDSYPGWDGTTEREVGYQIGCCLLVRNGLLQTINGFDDRFFYHFEEVDLCCRIWKTGRPILFYPDAEITHLGGQSVGRFPVRFALETYRSRYRYFFKHFGRRGVVRIRRISLLYLGVRYAGYRLIQCFQSSESLTNRLAMYRVLIAWNWRLNPVQFITKGEEPNVGFEPLAPAPQMMEKAA